MPNLGIKIIFNIIFIPIVIPALNVRNGSLLIDANIHPVEWLMNRNGTYNPRTRITNAASANSDP